MRLFCILIQDSQGLQQINMYWKVMNSFINLNIFIQVLVSNDEIIAILARCSNTLVHPMEDLLTGNAALAGKMFR